jgi:tetratricopeptide (TPR) repeat protein
LQTTVVADRPADVVRQATHAVEADSAPSAGARWRATLARDTADARALLGLATLARLTYDYTGAERHYAALVALTGSTPPAFRAWALLGMAESRLHRLPFDSAAVWFLAAGVAARASSDSVAEAEALFGLATAKLRTAPAATALAVVDSGLRIAPAGSAAIVALGHCLRAAVLWFQGAPRVREEATAGLAFARQARSRRQESFCLAMLGPYYLTIDGQARAIAMFDTAVSLAQLARDRAGAAHALWWRGNARLEAYEHDGARRDLSAALVESDASGNRFLAGWAWLRLAVVSWHFADMISARRELERGRSLLREQGDGWGQAYARSIDGAMALEAGQIDAAETAFRDDLTWAEQLRQPLEVFTATFGLARVAMSRGDWTTARARFDSAARVARQHELVGYLPQLAYEYGLVAMRAGDLTSAERSFRALIAPKSGVSNLDRYAARSRIAEIHLARGDVDRAERELTDATDAIDSLRAALGDRALRVLAFQAHKGYDDNDLGFASIIAALTARGRTEAAFALAERRRARELRDRLVQSVATLTTPGVGVVAASRAPDPSTAVLEYVTGSGNQPTTLFVVSASRVAAVRLPPADSAAADILAFAGLVEAGAGARVLARRLGDAVFGSALDSLPAGVSRLIVVADGLLQRLPFDALRIRDDRYVIERFAVSLAPSAAVATELYSRSRPNGASGRLLAFGDPKFANEVAGGSSAADIYREAFSMNGGLPRLRGSAAEARLVARFALRSELRLRERASESYLKHAPLDSFDVIHLATHALVDERSVARTALAVADGDGDDGFVGPGELGAFRLGARLVVLSACRTAQGVAVRGEGVQGLTAPLLAAGARSVLATQWRVRDVDAIDFIDDFYRALAGGSSVGDAARAAKLAAIGRGSPPATWAAFAVVGDASITVPLRVPSEDRRWPIVFVALAVAGLLYGGVMWTRRVAERRSVPSANRAVTLQ